MHDFILENNNNEPNLFVNHLNYCELINTLNFFFQPQAFTVFYFHALKNNFNHDSHEEIFLRKPVSRLYMSFIGQETFTSNLFSLKGN